MSSSPAQTFVITVLAPIWSACPAIVSSASHLVAERPLDAHQLASTEERLEPV
jgi:hypothetical protein